MNTRPSDLCRGLLAALDASEGRRRRRQRDTTPDAIGFRIKRELLEAAIRDDPDPDSFEAWLLARCLAANDTVSMGAVRAIARDVLTEWRRAAVSPQFSRWLDRGAPSEDRAS
jgi:hypothetical protein